MKKLSFALEHEDNWPPVSSEAVWCGCVGNNFKLLNAPCFIKGLTNHDVLTASPNPVNAAHHQNRLHRAPHHAISSANQSTAQQPPSGSSLINFLKTHAITIVVI
jgi:hypothetical protein